MIIGRLVDHGERRDLPAAVYFPKKKKKKLPEFKILLYYMQFSHKFRALGFAKSVYARLDLQSSPSVCLEFLVELQILGFDFFLVYS